MTRGCVEAHEQVGGTVEHTRNDEFLIHIPLERLLRHQIEPLHRVLHHLLIPLLIQRQLIRQKLLEDPVQERAPTQPPGPGTRLLHLQNRLQRRHLVADQIHRPATGIAQHERIPHLNTVRVHRMQRIDGRRLGLGDDLQILAHPRVEGARPRQCLRLVGPHGGDGDDVFDRRGLDDRGGQLVLQHLLRVRPQRGQVVRAQLLGRGVVTRRQGVLVRVLAR